MMIILCDISVGYQNSWNAKWISEKTDNHKMFGNI